MTKPHVLNPNSVSLAGEFAVLSQLTLMGYDASLTLGKTKNIDILVSDPRTNRMLQVEVKTNLEKRKVSDTNSKIFGRFAYSWIMSKKQEKEFRKELWYCFVVIDAFTLNSRFFILPSQVVANYVIEEHQLWLSSNVKNKTSDIRNFRIGFKGENYPIKTPTIEKYENNWFFKL